MHALHRVRFPVALPLDSRGHGAAFLLGRAGFRDFFIESYSSEHVYVHPLIAMVVTPAALTDRWLEVRDVVEPLGGMAFPPYVLWHSRFTRKVKSYYPAGRRRRPSERARLRREAMLRDKRRQFS